MQARQGVRVSHARLQMPSDAARPKQGAAPINVQLKLSYEAMQLSLCVTLGNVQRRTVALAAWGGGRIMCLVT